MITLLSAPFHSPAVVPPPHFNKSWGGGKLKQRAITNFQDFYYVDLIGYKAVENYINMRIVELQTDTLISYFTVNVTDKLLDHITWVEGVL